MFSIFSFSFFRFVSWVRYFSWLNGHLRLSQLLHRPLIGLHVGLVVAVDVVDVVADVVVVDVVDVVVDVVAVDVVDVVDVVGVDGVVDVGGVDVGVGVVGGAVGAVVAVCVEREHWCFQ